MQTPDALTADELRQAFTAAQARAQQAPPSLDTLAAKSARRRARYLPASPVEAAIAAANHVGWVFRDPYTLLTGDGHELQLL